MNICRNSYVACPLFLVPLRSSPAPTQAARPGRSPFYFNSSSPLRKMDKQKSSHDYYILRLQMAKRQQRGDELVMSQRQKEIR
mmetsp:Transcript_17894/g.29700  ORF Transcript_17894/g.29700 Transcript_17894/m.29700 type:complete len:83 (+) Transcript_17894:66-314(+)